MQTSLRHDTLTWASQLSSEFLSSAEIKFFYLFRSELITIGYTPETAALLALKHNVYLSWIDEDDDFLSDLASKLGEGYAKALDQLRAMNITDKNMTDPVVDKLFFQKLRPQSHQISKSNL